MGGQLTRGRTRVAGFDDDELDFQLIRQLGLANYGGASVGQTLAVAAVVRERGQPEWTPAFRGLAERLEADAEHRVAAGHRVSARDMFLLACNSYRAAEYFAEVGTAQRAGLGTASERAFAAAIDLAAVAYERLQLEVDGLSLPGYWFGPTGPGSDGRILIATSGFDGTLEETYLQVGRAATDRGWQLLLIAGPGQADTGRSYPDVPSCPTPSGGSCRGWMLPPAGPASMHPG